MTTATLKDTPVLSRPQSRPAQQSALARIAEWCHDHRWWVLIVWLVALVASNVFAQMAGSAFSNNLTGGKQEVQQILNANFPNQAGSPAQVVVTTGDPVHGRSLNAGPYRRAAVLFVPCPMSPPWSAPSLPRGAHRSRGTDTSATCASSSTNRPETCRQQPSKRLSVSLSHS